MQDLQDRVEEVEANRVVLLLRGVFSQRRKNLKEKRLQVVVVSQLLALLKNDLESLHV